MTRAKRKTYNQNCAKLALTRKIRRTLQKYYKLTFILTLAFLGFISVWMAKEDDSKNVVEYAQSKFYLLTASAGLRLESVTFDGDKYLGQNQLIQELGLLEGTPILSFDLDKLRDEIKQRNWVKEASLHRKLPSTLEIRISEREPVAVWQYKHELNLIDEDGVVLTKLDSADGLPFPLIVGEGANKDAKRIFGMLSKEKMLYDRVQAAVRLGDRRWNIVFMNGIEVMLPEDKADEAWKKLARMQMEKQVLDRSIKAIDFRIQDRVYIRANETVKDYKDEGSSA